MTRCAVSLVRFIRDCSGAIAAETALVVGFLVVLIGQVLDFGWFVYCSVQMKMAAQAAAAEAAVVCSEAEDLPALDNCEPTGKTLKEAMEEAANRVSIGGTITIADEDLKEGYYCSNGDALAVVTTPDSCSPYSDTEKPGDYVRVTVSYTFTPLFPGLSAISYSADAMKAEGWMRVG